MGLGHVSATAPYGVYGDWGSNLLKKCLKLIQRVGKYCKCISDVIRLCQVNACNLELIDRVIRAAR
ncbi:MAG: hypothetical protein J6S76_05660 [Clostridia bacterium]|nr:hypothetical protein [Clostridia bacterium]